MLRSFQHHVENYVKNVDNLFNVVVRVKSEAIFDDRFTIKIKKDEFQKIVKKYL